jgi:hypothetical protein
MVAGRTGSGALKAEKPFECLPEEKFMVFKNITVCLHQIFASKEIHKYSSKKGYFSKYSILYKKNLHLN